MKNVIIEINGKEIDVEEGSTILSAAESLEISIPQLCSHKALSPYGSCRMCLVEVSHGGRPAALQTSCTYPALDGLTVKTDSERVIKARKIMIELLLARCPESEKLQHMAKELGAKTDRLKPKNKDCILCGLCTRMCQERMGRSAIGFVGRGLKKEVQSPFGKPNEVCQICGACDFICPTGKIIMDEVKRFDPNPILSEFDNDLITRSSVYIPYPQAVPNVAAIDDRYCVHSQTGECGICKEFCEAGAIDYEQKDEIIDINAGAVILTNGVDLFDPEIKKELGYDRYDNVITSLQFERILSSSGPTKGEIVRSSDGNHPKKIAFIQCVGSRDPSCGHEYCSSVCCMYSIKEAVIAKEHDPDIDATIFYIDIRSFGKDFERYYEAAKSCGVKFVRCMVSKIYEQPKSKNLVVKFIAENGKIREDEFDLVTLAVGMTETDKHKGLSEILNIDTNEYGFCDVKHLSPGKTSREGIFIAGTYAEPKDIPETVAEGSSASALVSALLGSARGTLVKAKEYPPERVILDEEPRIGVFICRCGRNIASVVNVPEVVEYASTLDDVTYASEFLYSCSKDALDVIKEKILEHNLNRVVVASCTPRTHEDLFRDTVREVGVNRYLFEMTSLREQVSWVHKDDPKWATEKSKKLVSMMVAKTRFVNPLKSELADVTHAALIVGGGAAGMQAALNISEQGFEVYLIEKEDSLGGHLKDLYYNPGEPNTQEFLKQTIDQVNSNKKIHVMMNSKLKDITGFVGNFKSVIKLQDGEKEVEHGTVVIATGGKSYEPKENEYGFGKSSQIITQVDLEEKLTKDAKSFSEPKTIVMVQCVGSRNDEHPYCSRVCCTHAIKNALKLKELNPEHNIVVLYRDIRTYGFMEKYYLKAREVGVVFSCFDKDREPEVNVKGDAIVITQYDKLLNDEVKLNADWLVLSAGILPQENVELAKTIKVPLTTDGFFLEAHAKIRPLDFTSDGMFMCGLAHSPRLLNESLTQAQGASVRSTTILSKDKIEAKAIVAEVNTRVCRGCGICISVCPYGARELDGDTKVARVIDVLCQGCGACAVACPSGASTHKGFTKKQILEMIDKSI